MQNIDEFISKDHLDQLKKRFFIENNNSHEFRVLKYSLETFDVLSTAYSMGRKRRTLLYYSALLHDIGYEISPQKHDYHTRNIISTDPIFDIVPHPERLMIALIAGGHRKKLARELNQLSIRNQQIVKQLAAILRIADAIDYPRDSCLSIKRLLLKSDCLEISIESTAFSIVAIRVSQKSSLFEESFGLTIETKEIS